MFERNSLNLDVTRSNTIQVVGIKEEEEIYYFYVSKTILLFDKIKTL